MAGSVKFETVNGDGVGAVAAEAGTDYVAASGTLTWLATDSAPKQFDVALIDDKVFEPVEYFRALLTSASDGIVVVDGRGLATINDDDALVPAVSVVGPSYGCWQLDGKCTIDSTMSSAVASAVTMRFESVSSSDVEACPDR